MCDILYFMLLLAKLYLGKWMNRITIQEIAVGESVCSVFLVSAATKSESKNGPFWRIELKDATGTLEAKIWSPLSLRVPELKAGDFIEAKGKTSLFREQMQLTIEAIRPVENPEDLDIADFLPSSAIEPIQILAQIEALVQAELSYAPWKNFVKAVLNNPRIRSKLLLAPAAKSVHHAYAGGLLEHMHSVAGVCLKFADHYPELDRETLFVAALFHDIGKLEELSGGLLNDYTDEGRLLGHIVQGIMLLRPFLEKAKVDSALILHFEHLILSHHGELEFGAPKTPMTPEAFALHYADNIDAKLAQCREVFAGMQTTQKVEAKQMYTIENRQEGYGQNLQNSQNVSSLPTGIRTDKAYMYENDKDASKDASVGTLQTATENIVWSPWVKLLGRTLCTIPKTPSRLEIERGKNRKIARERQGSLLD